MNTNKWIVLIEIILISIAVIRIIKMVMVFKRTNTAAPIEERIEETVRLSIKNKFASFVIAREVIMLYYFFTPVKPTDKEKDQFSYHQKVGYFGIFIVFLIVMILESVSLSFLLHRWSPLLSWFHIILNVYGIIYLISDYKSILSNPIKIHGHEVVMAIGFRRKISFDLENIKMIHQGNLNYDKYKKDKNVFKAILIEIEAPHLEIILKTPVITRDLFGRTKPIDRIFVTLDHKEEFMNRLSAV